MNHQGKLREICILFPYSPLICIAFNYGHSCHRRDCNQTRLLVYFPLCVCPCCHLAGLQDSPSAQNDNERCTMVELIERTTRFNYLTQARDCGDDTSYTDFSIDHISAKGDAYTEMLWGAMIGGLTGA